MKIKKIVLVDPKLPKYRYMPGFNEWAEPIGLCYISSYLKLKGYDSQIIQQLDETDEEIINKIIKNKPDLMCFTAVTCNFPRAKRAAKIIKEKLGVSTVIGGVHATADPINSAKYFDYVVIGEGEATMVGLVEHLNENKSLENIDGLYYSDKGRIKRNKKRPRLEFKNQPWPDRKNLKIKRYIKSGFPQPPYPEGVKNVATILGSKGCPYNCSFCINKLMWNQIVKVRDIKDIADELEYLMKDHKVNYIWFDDTTFTFDSQRVEKLCDEILKRKIDIYWACEGRVDTVNKNLLLKMKKAGCVFISYGIESADEKILKLLNKQISLYAIKKAMKITFDANIVPVAFFMIGLPYDTITTLNNLRKFAIKIKALRYRVAYFYPFLGTRDRMLIDQKNLWISKKHKRKSLATTLEPVVRCRAGIKFLKNFSRHILRDIYSSKEYQERKDKFLNKNSEYAKSYKTWKEYQNAIKEIIK